MSDIERIASIAYPLADDYGKVEERFAKVSRLERNSSNKQYIAHIEKTCGNRPFQGV